MPYTITTPVPGQNISAALFGLAVKNAINDLDARVSALESFTTGKPVCKLVAGAAQSIPDNTDTALQFAAADVIDTHAMHDPVTNNTRITPTVAGTYRFTAGAILAARTDFSFRRLWIRKNGTTGLAPADAQGNMVNSVVASLKAETVEAVNGTTDYLEAVMIQDNTANVAVLTNNSVQFSCTFMAEFLRGLP